MKFDENFSYWLGLVHADGFISKYVIKGKNQTKYEFGLETISEVLIKEFCSGLKQLGRHVSILKTKRNTYKCKISANSIVDTLASLNIKLREGKYNPPESVCKNDKLFGAYLAGVIDGDGDIRIKRKNTYPQCMIRVSSGSLQANLNQLIKQKMKCAVLETFREVNRKGKVMRWYELEFLISRKNVKFISSFVLPHIKLTYKKDKMKNFIENAMVV
ncbi:MAG TPA: hypothetical protein HA230_03555 [Candidatus Aenigmarchaeota archaeon]|nr:hypothetical protein [Candidatus Aenigmarchaeota archaeon]